MLDEKFISELKQKNNIVDFIGKYCALQKKGSNYWACCPLPGHSERTPSFSVNENGQFYKCFGCGRGGDVITFAMTVENKTYIEAVRFLAEQVKMQIPEDEKFSEENKQRAIEKQTLMNLLRDTAIFYVSNLKKEEATKFLNYLDSRQIDRKTRTAFGIGASLDMFSLPNYLKSKGYTEEQMLISGVCQKKKSKEGKDFIFDALSGRLVIPIIDNLDNVIAFGGRVLESNPDFAKYKNTQGTQIFIKNRTLFNINSLKKLRQEGTLKSIIMVEGYMDVISVYKAGFKNVVASMGTSLTKEQAKILKRYSDKVYISYDGDGAGQNATMRGLDILADEGIEVKVVSIPNGQDPDDIIKYRGAEGYQKLLDKAMPLVDFKLNKVYKKYNLNDSFQKKKFVQECLDVIRECKTQSEKEDLLKKLRDVSSLSFESLKRDLENKKVENKEIINEKVADTNKDKIILAERYIISSLILNKPYTDDINFNNFVFSSSLYQKLVDYVLGLKEDGKKIVSTAIYDLVGESELGELNAIFTAGDGVFGTSNEVRFFSDCVKVLRKDNLENQLKELIASYKEETDINKREEISKLIVNISKKIKNI